MVSVLLVDDARDEREAYAEHLHRRGYATFQAASANEAIEIAHARLPTIVVTDMVLRGAPSGLDLLVRLKADERTRTMPVIMLTVHAFELDRVEAARAGADLFLAKPCLPEQLAAEIEHLLAFTHTRPHARPDRRKR